MISAISGACRRFFRWTWENTAPFIPWAISLEYQLSLALRLGFLRKEQHAPIADLAAQTSKTLTGLIRPLRKA